MKLTYRQIESAVLQVFEEEFVKRGKMQKRIDRCGMACISVEDLVYLMHWAKGRDCIEIESEVCE